MLGTLDKADRVLALYTPTRPEWGVTEAARALAEPPSSTHLLMSSLARMGVLHRTGAGRYRLGFRLLTLGQILLATTPWRETVSDHMRALSRATGETTHLAALDGAHLTTVAAQPGPRPGATAPARIGDAPPLHASAAGKVLLAARTDPHALLPTPLPRFTPATRTTRAALDRELRAARAHGYAVNAGEFDPDLHAVAAPIRDHNGETVAALSLLAPPARFTARRVQLIHATRDAAGAASRAIGHVPELDGPERPVWTSVAGEDTLHAPARRGPPRR